MRAWAGQFAAPEANDRLKSAPDEITLRSLAWLDETWAQRLRDAGNCVAGAGNPAGSVQAIERLRRMHGASTRLDLVRVHPSWCVRALVDESPAVQRAVTAALHESIRHPVQAGLLLDTQDLRSQRRADPETLGWVLGLWAERLVGGEPERPDDPPAIVALSRLSPRAGYGLCRLAGFCKLLLAGRQPRGERLRSSRQERWEWLRGRLAAASVEFRAEARREVDLGVSDRIASRHHPARLGLVTFGRLLAECEPFRVRWALQHWPYPMAKLTRSLMAAAATGSTVMFEGEALVLKTVWDRLNLEGRLCIPWPDR
jgi:hypothetical protein